MSTESQPNLLMWLVTTFIALLAAGGGVVAYLRYFRPPRPKLLSRLWMLDNPYYELIEDQSKLSIRRNNTALPGPAHAEASSLYPALELDVTNPTGSRISINAIRLSFAKIRALRPAEIVVQFRPGASAESREALARKHGLQLVESDDDLYTYWLSTGQAADVVAQVEAESEIVEYAFTNEGGEPHKRFTVTKKVDVKLEPERRDYTYLIAETVAPHDSVKIPVFIGASESITGTASVTIMFEADKSHDVGELEIMIEVPDYVLTT